MQPVTARPKQRERAARAIVSMPLPGCSSTKGIAADGPTRLRGIARLATGCQPRRTKAEARAALRLPF